MSNLPINWQDKENSPELQAYLAQFGRQFYIDADEANQVRDAINELAEGTFPDMVLKSGKAEITGLNMSIAANAFAWRINQVTFSNPPAFNKTLTAASEGNYRADILVGTTEGTYLVVQGPESPNAAIEPDAPDGTIRLTGVVLFGAVVGQPIPTPTTNYVQKSERANVILTGSGVINMLTLADEKATVVFKGSVTRLNTITYPNIPYNGKTIRLFNAQNTPVTIGNAVSGYAVDFIFPDGQDYVLQPNQTIEFSFDMTYFPYAHHMFIGGVVSGGKETTSDIFSKELLTIADLSTNTGFVNTESGIKGGVLGIENCTIQFPAIDYTRKFRIDLVVRVLNATNVNARVEIKKSGNNWQGLSYFEVGAGNITMNKTHLNSQGVSEIPDNSTFQYSLIGNGKRVVRNIFPISAKWDGDYATTYLPPFTGQIISQTEVFNYNPSGTVEMFKGIDEISITGTNTNDLVISSVNVQYFDELVAYDHKSYLATLMDISVLNDAIDDVFPAFLYCPVNSKGLIQWHHPNGYNGTIEKDIYGNIFSELFNDGYAICYGTFNSYNVPAGTALWGAGVTSSNWGSPTGMVYRKALNDYCDALIKADHFIQMGGSMGAFNALSYAARFPSKIRAVIGFSGALDLTYNFNTNFTNTIRKAYGAAYRCIAESTGNNTSNNTFWVKIANETDAPQLEEYGNPFLDTYSPSKTYVPGDIVFENYTGDVAGLAEFDLIANPRTLNKLPILLIHGDSDTLIGDEQSSNFQTAVNNTEGDVKLILIPGADHLDIAVFDYVAVDRFLKRVNLSSDDVLDKSGITNGSMTDALEYLNEEKQSKKTKITTEPNITKTLTATDEHILFTNANAVTFTIPTNASVQIPVGTKVRYTQQGDGIVSVAGAGITFVTNLSLAMVKGETRVLTKIATDTWSLEGNNKLDTIIEGAVFISSNGDDSTAVIGSQKKPFKTLNAALAATFSMPDIVNYNIISGGVFYITSQLNATKSYSFNSDYGCTITFINSSASFYNVNDNYFVYLKFSLPIGTVDFRSTTNKVISSIQIIIEIDCNTMTIDSTFLIHELKRITLKVVLLNHISGVFIDRCGNDSKIEVVKISGGSGTLVERFLGGNNVITFYEINCTGAYVISAGYSNGNLVINHGIFITTSTSNYSYINNGGPVTINYFNNSKVKGNVTMGQYNWPLIITISGQCDFSENTNYLFTSANNQSNGIIRLLNANLKIKGVFREEIGINANIEIVNSYIEVTEKLINVDYQLTPKVLVTPIVVFKGHNVVYCLGSTTDYIYLHPNVSGGFIKIIGTLKTNGLLQQGITTTQVL